MFRIKIRHDNSMVSADWYLDQVEVLDVDTEEVYLFLCERWLSKKREDRRIERFFYVKVNDSFQRISLKYRVLMRYFANMNKEIHTHILCRC